MSLSTKPETTLRKLRRSQGLTQRQLAERVGLSELGLAKLDRGESRPHLTTALLLAAVLRCDPADLRACNETLANDDGAPAKSAAVETEPVESAQDVSA